MSADLRLVAGLLLAAVGAVGLAGAAGVLDAPAVGGPVLLLVLGAALLVVGGGGRQRSQSAQPPPQRASVSLDGASRSRLQLDHGAGALSVHGGAPAGVLCEGTFPTGVRQEVRRSGDQLQARLRPDPDGLWGSAPGGWSGPVDWDVAVGTEAPLALEVRTGASSVHLDLTGVPVEEVLVKAGASDVQLVLPARGRMDVRIAAGAADVRVLVPEGMAVDVRNRSALAGLAVDDAAFPGVDGGFRSPGFATAADRATVELEGGVASFSVQPAPAGPPAAPLAR
jgi:hypothetical protein